jgi:outer membrane protein OmpA-like peptidoglycan-associated protein
MESSDLKKSQTVRTHAGRTLVVAAVALLTAAGCATPGKRTVVGGAGGAVVGAGVGAAAGGKKGAAIGAAAGAVTGGLIGNYLDKRAAEMNKVAETEKTEDGLLVKMPGDLLFAHNSAVLAESATQQVQQVGDILAKYPKDRIRVEGHTDATGPDRYNEELSLKRADAVARVLRSRGVQESQMLVRGLGESRPVADNGSDQGRSQNRRVQLVIDVEPPQTAAR